jgi:hypothetical protein
MTAPETKPASVATCERCGSFEPLQIAGTLLCADCVAEAGCACTGNDTED